MFELVVVTVDIRLLFVLHVGIPDRVVSINIFTIGMGLIKLLCSYRHQFVYALRMIFAGKMSGVHIWNVFAG